MSEPGGAAVPLLEKLGTAKASGRLLPDPEPREVRYTVISVDDHLVEPPHLFEGRLPARLQDRAPRIVEDADGRQQWVYEDAVHAQIGLNAVSGRPFDEWITEAIRFDQMRRGCWDVHARIRDMDLDGVWASLAFPSSLPGFCGRVFCASKDQELGLATLRAWNDWMAEEWHGSYPDRLIPIQIPWMPDPEIGAAEIRRNAERGFHAVSMPELPHNLGYPSLHSGYWDPIIVACAETETVICLHVGSTGLTPVPPGAPMIEELAINFLANAFSTCVDWLWSGLPVRYPDLKIAHSEAGLGWVPMLLDRLDSIYERSGYGKPNWMSKDLSPSDVLRRNFWFCTIEDPSTIALRDRIGIDHIMVESDYPHGDSTWPDTQPLLAKWIDHLPVEDIRKITHQNAATLFHTPLPQVCLP